MNAAGINCCRSCCSCCCCLPACHPPPPSLPPSHRVTSPHPPCLLCLLQGHFIISPRVTFEVPVRILGGLMALGYEIGSIMRRTSEVYADSE